MMRSLERRERTVVTLWLVLGVVVWNGLYDLLLSRGITNYLLEHAMYAAGRGPYVSLARELDLAVRDAGWISTLWSSLIVLAGLVTVRVLTGGRSGAPAIQDPPSGS
jgi:hypothetical protein